MYTRVWQEEVYTLYTHHGVHGDILPVPYYTTLGIPPT